MNRRRKILIVAGIILGVAILVPVIYHYQLRFAVHSYVAELKAKGEPMDLAQVIPSPTPEDQNGASIFLKAASLFPTNRNVLYSNPPEAMRLVAPGKALVVWQQSDVRTKYGTNSWEDVAAALAQDDGALNLLGAITNKTALDFDLQYSQRLEMLLPHLTLEKKAAQKLSYAAVYDLHVRDTASAVQKVRLILTLVNEMRDERIAISQLVRIAITQIAASTTWEILQSPYVTDQQLADLQVDWSRLEFVKAAANVLPVEREGSDTSVAKWRSSDLELQRYLAYFQPGMQAISSVGEEKSIRDKAKKKSRIFLWRY